MLSNLEKIAKRAYSSYETIQASYDIAAAAIINDVPGHFVECGVGAGANAAAMACAIVYYTFQSQSPIRADSRRVHLFDSFSGIPQAGPEDVEFLAAGHKPGLSAHSMAEVRANMREWQLPDELFVYHEGLFEHTVPEAVICREAGHISVLRLDGDLYESTKVCIENFYPLVSKGGWVIVDDWDLSGARKAVIDHVGHGFGPIYWRKQS
jgi:O-methyltransferase